MRRGAFFGRGGRGRPAGTGVLDGPSKATSKENPHVAKVTKSFQYGDRTITLETGEIARQAGGAVVVSCEGTVLLVTAVANKTAREGQDFFPLTVDYQEKFYAGGRIPGGF